MSTETSYGLAGTVGVGRGGRTDVEGGGGVLTLRGARNDVEGGPY